MSDAFLSSQGTISEEITALKKKLDAVIVAHNYQLPQIQEVADVMKIPTATVGVRIKRGKDMIRKILKK